MEYIKGIFVIWLIYKYFAWVAKQERQYEEITLNKKLEAKRKEDEAIRSEIELVERAYAALPNIDVAMAILKDRYGWREILQTIGIYDTHLSLLKKIYYSQPSEIILPNMQSSTYGSDEWRVIKNARKKHKSYYLYNNDMSFREEYLTYGIDSLAQEPTVNTLVRLNGYVDTNVPITSERKSFVCELKKSGEALIRLNGEYTNNIAGNNDIKYPPRLEVCSKISSVLYRALYILENSETDVLDKSE